MRKDWNPQFTLLISVNIVLKAMYPMSKSYLIFCLKLKETLNLDYFTSFNLLTFLIQSFEDPFNFLNKLICISLNKFLPSLI